MVKKKKESKISLTQTKEPETMLMVNERDIAMDFATKIYKRFDTLVKSIILFGSSTKNTATSDSDIDIIVIIDDVSVKWDMELIAWYREELGKTISSNPYIKSLHVNTVKLSTWWSDLTKGDPIIINILRYGDTLIDTGGFFEPLKVLLKEGQIRSTPEAIYTLLQRAPNHMARARTSMLAVVDGLYWACVDSAHSALISAKVMPASPEHIANVLYETFVREKILKQKYVDDFNKIHMIAKEIVHGKRTDIKGKDLDEFFIKTDEFVREMARVVNELIKN